MAKKLINKVVSTFASAFTELRSECGTQSAKLCFIAPLADPLRVRLIVEFGSVKHVCYTYRATVDVAGVKPGDKVSILVEEREVEGKVYWNVTAISKE